MLNRHALFIPLSLLVACGAEDRPRSNADASLLAHQGALQCSDLQAVLGPTTLDAECTVADIDAVTVTSESLPIRASIDRVYAALTDPEQFGAFPRPLPDGFEPPPVPHSVAHPSMGAPFLGHYVLFYGALQTTTVREHREANRIEIVQLWRVNPVWTEPDLERVYPDLSDAQQTAMIGTPIMPEGLRTIVTFKIHRMDNALSEYSYVSMVQHGLPRTSFPLVKHHWPELYFLPMKTYLESQP